MQSRRIPTGPRQALRPGSRPSGIRKRVPDGRRTAVNPNYMHDLEPPLEVRLTLLKNEDTNASPKMTILSLLRRGPQSDGLRLLPSIVTDPWTQVHDLWKTTRAIGSAWAPGTSMVLDANAWVLREDPGVIKSIRVTGVSADQSDHSGRPSGNTPTAVQSSAGPRSTSATGSRIGSSPAPSQGSPAQQSSPIAQPTRISVQAILTYEIAHSKDVRIQNMQLLTQQSRQEDSLNLQTLKSLVEARMTNFAKGDIALIIGMPNSSSSLSGKIYRVPVVITVKRETRKADVISRIEYWNSSGASRGTSR